MKSHFSQTHKNKGKGTKRVAASKIFLSEMDLDEIIDVEEKRTKVNEESFDFSQNGAIFNSTMQLCAQTIGKDNLNKEFTGLDNEVEEIVNGGGDFSIAPDQDHNYLINPEDDKN